MKKFNYKARDQNGALVKGEVEALNEDSAAKLVIGRGLVVISVKKKSDGFLSFLGRFKKGGGGDIATFTRQLATMINAGLPLTSALSILRGQTKKSLAPIVTQLLVDIEGGESFSKALGKHPDFFSRTYIALVKVGETGGVLDNILERLADNLEKEQEFKGKVKGAMVYPAIIIVGMLIVGLIMTVVVIPKMVGVYSEFGAELPTPTKILISVSSFMVKAWPLLLLLVLLSAWGFSIYRKTPEGMRKTDELFLKIPVFGDLQKQIILTELTRTMALMIGSGVSILDALAVTADVVGNSLISDALRDAAGQIQKGFPIAYSFAKHPKAFPLLLSQMVAVGEETGKMEEVMGKVSRIFEIESDQKVKVLTSSIEPIVMIILGIGVGFLVIAVILPIYNLTSQL